MLLIRDLRDSSLVENDPITVVQIMMILRLNRDAVQLKEFEIVIRVCDISTHALSYISKISVAINKITHFKYK